MRALCHVLFTFSFLFVLYIGTKLGEEGKLRGGDSSSRGIFAEGNFREGEFSRMGMFGR